MIIKRGHIRRLSFYMVIVAATLVAMSFPCFAVDSRIYTSDADFDGGTLVGVEHKTVDDRLQLSKTPVTLPFIWVPNQDGTVSKVNIETGDELGRYRVAPPDLPLGGNPSRTTVDLQGNCWVGNRQAGTAVKIGLYETGQCVDRNGNGIIDTSQDLNNDKSITSGEILDWGKDECVLYEVVLVPDYLGTYIPGTYPGPYDYKYFGVSPRGFAVDASNNVWVGTWSTSKYYYIDGATGAILKTVDVSPWGHHAYGAVIDSNGVLWSSSLDYYHILRLDPSKEPPAISKVNMCHIVYGLGLDYLGHLFASGWENSRLSRINITTATTDWTYDKSETYKARGVVCTSDNDVWVASSQYGTVLRYSNDGDLKATINVGNQPTGVAVDAVGKIWVCNLGDEYIKRIDPATNSIDLQKRIIGSGGHYTYSDMTGIVARTITTKIGTWTVIYDSKGSNTAWGTVSWTSSEPEGTSVTVKVRSSNDKKSWSTWETAKNGFPLSTTPGGRYLQIEATLQILSGDISPILYDLTVMPTGNTQPNIDDSYPSISCLWPPDNKFVDITIQGVTDPNGDPITITIISITSDEPTASISGAAGAKHSPDASIIETLDGDIASLRAERSGKGNGRVYRINFTASDGEGGVSEGYVDVCVPHDMRGNTCSCVDDGIEYDATQIN